MNYYRECPECEGTGEVTIGKYHTGMEGCFASWYEVECQMCHGYGELTPVCNRCDQPAVCEEGLCEECLAAIL